MQNRIRRTAPSFCRGLTLAPALAVAIAVAPLPARADGLPPKADRAEDGAHDAAAARRVKSGPQRVFFRADDLAALRARTFAASYAVESGKNLGDAPEPFGIRHRLQVGFAATDWLKLSVEQNMKHRLDTGELRVGVVAPEVRLTLRGMLPDSVGKWPLDVSAFFGPRIRIMGRRDPSAVFGFGTNTPQGSFHFTVNEAVEITAPGPDEVTETEFGPRYDLGVGYEIGRGFVACAEVWGHAAWSRGGYVEQEHHAGPSLEYVYGVARVSIGGAAGRRDEVRSKAYELSGMLSMGLEI